MDKITEIKRLLREPIENAPTMAQRFFKTGVGDYAEHDQFLGVKVPMVRKIAQAYGTLTLEEIHHLISSPFNEERLTALFILVQRYQKASAPVKEEIYQFYLSNLNHVNNWNLVDSSAHLIMGAHLWERDKNILLKLASSPDLWHRRIAIVSTWYFIGKREMDWTFKLSEVLIADPHDLIHKAVGWMLREAGKRDQSLLIKFLDQHAKTMPRTMLRYSIEKFPEELRKAYLGLKNA